MKQPSPLVSWLLRIGLALTFFYAGVAAIISPLEWAGFLPPLLTAHGDPQLLVHGFAVYEMALALWLLFGWRLRVASALCALTFAGIIVLNLGQLIVTFRDFGLLFAAAALYCTDIQNDREHRGVK